MVITTIQPVARPPGAVVAVRLPMIGLGGLAGLEILRPMALVIVGGLIIFAVGSFLAAWGAHDNSIYGIIAGRALQGAGGGDQDEDQQGIEHGAGNQRRQRPVDDHQPEADGRPHRREKPHAARQPRRLHRQAARHRENGEKRRGDAEIFPLFFHGRSSRSRPEAVFACKKTPDS